MKLAFVIGDISSTGGIERVLSILTDSFVDMGHEITIVSLFKANNNVNYYFNHKVNIVYLSQLKYALETQGGWKRLLMFIKVLPKVKSFFSKNCFDLILGEGFPVNWTLYLIGQKNNVIACEHVYYNYYNTFIRKIREEVYRHFAAVVVLTENDKKHYTKKNNNICVIPNPVIIENLYQSDLSSNNMISVGRLEKPNGYDMLLKSLPIVFERFPEWKLNIWGEGTLKADLIKLRNRLGLQKYVNFCGNTKEIEKQYLSSSLFVMSSRYEGFPMVLIEAAAHGLPIVSFDCPEGPADILKEDRGVLVTPNDTDMLSKSLIEMLGNVQKRKYYACRGKEVVNEYSIDVISQKWEKLFKNTIGK